MNVEQIEDDMIAKIEVNRAYREKCRNPSNFAIVIAGDPAPGWCMRIGAYRENRNPSHLFFTGPNGEAFQVHVSGDGIVQEQGLKALADALKCRMEANK